MAAESSVVRPVVVPAAQADSRPVTVPVAQPNSRPADVPFWMFAASGRTALPTMHGMPLLRQLAVMSEGSIGGFLSANPDAVRQVLAAPPSTALVTGWWSGLTGDAQTALVQSAPELVGNLNGVPFGIRDEANRVFLGQRIGAQETREAQAGRAQRRNEERHVHMLNEAIRALEPGASEAHRSLLSVDSAGAGRAAVVIGDLETADFVTIMVPGMFFLVDGQIVDWTDSTEVLYDEQQAWVDKLGLRGPDGAPATVAAISWMGYETPGLLDVASLDLAYGGRDALAETILGIQALRGAHQPHLTIIGHSYGSTTAMMALTGYDVEVDALAMIGSPGGGADAADALHVRGGNIYVGAAAWDPVPGSGFFGVDPGAAEFGALPFGTDGGIDSITGRALLASTGHNEYFGAGTESIRNLALIGLGEGALATPR